MDCEFTYDGKSYSYCLASDNIAYLKAQTDYDIRVKLPQRIEIKKHNGKAIKLIDAFYKAHDGVIKVTVVCQNKYGVKRLPIQSIAVKKEITKK